MELSIRQTNFQKQFLALVSNQSIDFYKPKFNAFNFSSELDHSLTNTIFNLINKEIASVLDIVPVLNDSFGKLQAESKHIKKELLVGSNMTKLSFLEELHPRIADKLYLSGLKNPTIEYNFLNQKFSSSMDKLITFMGVYEELYLINTLALSYGSSYSLSYDNNSFSFGIRTKTISFKVCPIFFVVKYLLPTCKSDYSKKKILEKLIFFNFQSVRYLLTISDMEQIDNFYDICTMKYLTDFVMNKMLQDEQFHLPKIINLSQLHV